MIVEQLYTNCLAQGAYYIESNGEAAVIDPLRETEQYVELAKSRNAQIKYIFETHFHADFVSGHLDLAKKTGAKIIFGPNANPNYEFYSAKDNEILNLGDVSIKVLHTPGHTLESTSFLLLDINGKETSVFTGDTLFIGDVGRPDLAQKGTLTTSDLASYLFDSLRNKIMTLPDYVIVYPGHGAGSACGKKMSDETQSTIGLQKLSNYALQDISREQFIAEVTDGLTQPPSYFPDNVRMNKMGYEDFESIKSKGLSGLSYKNIIEELKKEDTLILDVRSPQEYAKQHIENSLHIGLDGNFAPWVGTLITNINSRIIIVSNQDRLEEAITRLARVGYDNIIGFVEGGVEEWANQGGKTETQIQIDAKEFSDIFSDDINLIDVRKESEYKIGNIRNAVNVPLDYIHNNYSKLNDDKTLYIHCLGGYRGTIASSILKRYGLKNTVVIYDNFQNIYDAVNNSELVA
jgi:glyoxylase-like metal-dependent hydrolase (beta-lactamase superfamily II)/rhodanese-related sulfurtransferase